MHSPFFISIVVILYCKIYKIAPLLNIAKFGMGLKFRSGKDMASKVFADTAVGVAHCFITVGSRRKFQHIAVALIQYIDFISVCSAVSSEFVYFT